MVSSLRSLITILGVLATLFLSGQATAGAVSQKLVFLQGDGEHYLTQRTLRSSPGKHRFHLDKSLSLDQIGYIDPNDFAWDDSGEHTNVLTFSQGDFTVMYPGRFEAPELTREQDGTFVYQSWEGVTRDDGHFGMWHEPGNFSRFNYAWVLPAHFELVDYVSNRDGQWVERGNTLTFFAEEVNDLTFTIRYRLRDGDGVVDRRPGTDIGAGVLDKGRDRDGDGVTDADDLCGRTPAGAEIDIHGCAIDSDKDGVIDLSDRCTKTASGVLVDVTGCEPDLDGDGVRYSLDRCHDTPAGSAVDEAGCRLDSDGDGVVGESDQCPQSTQGAEVNRNGCEIDCDGDRVVNSLDQCPRTPEGRSVDEKGCELDGDADSVIDALDACPDTAPGTAVDAAGCPPDDGNGGARNVLDLRPATKAGVEVDATGSPNRQPIRLDGVNFLSNSDELTEESRAILDRVAESLSQHTDLAIEIAGHTDSLGDTAYNRDLSQRRANAVQQYLIARGVQVRALIATGYGAERPVADNSSAEGRAMNRRVELKRIDE